MTGPVSDNGTPWNQLPGATGGLRRRLTPRPQPQLEYLEKIFLTPFARIAAALTGGDPEDWDTIDEIIDQIVGGLGVPDFAGLLEALQGNYTGDDPKLLQIQLWAGGLGGLVGVLGELGKIPLWRLDNGAVEVIDRFDTSDSVDGSEGWSWDGATGHDKNGSALFTAGTEQYGELLSPTPIEVAPGEQYTVSTWVQSTGAAAGGGCAVSVQWYDADHQPLSISTEQATDPQAVTSWTKLEGTVTVPAGAKWARRRLSVAALSAGEVRFDDVRFAGTATSIAQDWVTGLPDALQGLLDYVEAWVNAGLGALGLPALGSLGDRILDLGDGLSDLQDTADDAAAAVQNLFDSIGRQVGATLEDVEDRLNEFLTPLSDLDATKLVGSVAASLVTGVLDIARIPTLTSAKIPNLDASKITSGQFVSSLIPTLPASKITDLPAALGMISDHADDIVDLQDTTQALLGVIGYGSSYMSVSPGVTTSPTRMPFDSAVGPQVGVTLSDGRYVLGSPGLWFFMAQTRFWGARYAPPRCYMDIVIRNPGGVEIARLKAMNSSEDEITVTNVMTAVVPSAGCTAEVQAWTSSVPILGSWRGIGGGYSTTRFGVHKWSMETG